MHGIKQYKELKILLFAVIVILLATNSHAIGIARSFDAVNFVPNTTIHFQYYVYNDEHKDGMAFVELEGSLANRTTVEPSMINFTADQVLIPFTVTMDLPEKPEGQLKIIVKAAPTKGGQLTANVAAEQSVKFSEEKPVEKPNITAEKPPVNEQVLPVKINSSTAKNIIIASALAIVVIATILNGLAYAKKIKNRLPAVQMPGEKYDKILVDYFKKGFETGMPEDLLVKKLSEAGWEKEAINKHLSYIKSAKGVEKEGSIEQSKS